MQWDCPAAPALSLWDEFHQGAAEEELEHPQKQLTLTNGKNKHAAVQILFKE